MGSTLPDYSSREGVWGGSPGLVKRSRTGVGAHVDRYFFSGIRLLGPSFLAAGMRLVVQEAAHLRSAKDASWQIEGNNSGIDSIRRIS